jgi:hypothetical protein
MVVWALIDGKKIVAWLLNKKGIIQKEAQIVSIPPKDIDKEEEEAYLEVLLEEYGIEPFLGYGIFDVR